MFFIVLAVLYAGDNYVCNQCLYLYQCRMSKLGRTSQLQTAFRKLMAEHSKNHEYLHVCIHVYVIEQADLYLNFYQHFDTSP